MAVNNELLRLLFIMALFITSFAVHVPVVEDESYDAADFRESETAGADTDIDTPSDEHYEDDKFEIVDDEIDLESEDGAPIDDEGDEYLDGYEVFDD